MSTKKQNTYTAEFKKTIVNLYRSGKTYNEIQKEYGISHSALANWIKLYSEVKIDDWIIPKKVDKKSKSSLGEIGRSAVIMRMRADRVIKAVDILKKSQPQLIKRSIISAVGFLSFKILEKALHNRVVIGMPFL